MTAAFLPTEPAPHSRRNIAIAAGVVMLHVGALYALQSGLLRRAVEVVVPVAIVSELITPPPPQPAPLPEVQPPRPVVQPRPQPAPRKVAAPSSPAPQRVAPQPAAAPDLPPAPSAPTGVVAPQPAPTPIEAPVVAAPAPVAPPAPPAPPARVELPSSSAEHLQNPQPAYPPMSRRLGEQGTVMLRVLIGTDGSVQEAELKQSSGFERLDRAALETVRKWRFVPGKRGGLPEAMWHIQPVKFVLE